eukprot:sb/3475716/
MKLRRYVLIIMGLHTTPSHLIRSCEPITTKTQHREIFMFLHYSPASQTTNSPKHSTKSPSPRHSKSGAAPVPEYAVEVPTHSVLTYVYHILPWLFEAFVRLPSDNLIEGKCEALRTLCRCLIR